MGGLTALASSNRPAFQGVRESVYSRMAAVTREYGDLLLAILFLLLFLYLRINIDELVAVGRVRGFVDPTFWPSWILNAAVVCSALLTVRLLLEKRKGPRKADERDEPSSPVGTGPEAAEGEPSGRVEGTSEPAQVATSAAGLSNGAHLLWWLGIPALLFGFIYALRYAGFVPATLTFGVLYTLYLRERNPLIVLGLPAVVVGVILFVFTQLLSVPLPRGVGIFHTFSLWFY